LEVTLHTCPSSYVLGLPEQALDARRFCDLAEQWRLLLSSGQLDTVSGTLRQALECWNGPMLVDVDSGSMLQADTVRLEEIRNNVLEQRIEADILLGRPRELVSELTGLVAEQLMHEGFQAKLMLALYRADRRSDALEAWYRSPAPLPADGIPAGLLLPGRLTCRGCVASWATR
jgi:DNA-binding SARP family transcriptional activator